VWHKRRPSEERSTTLQKITLGPFKVCIGSRPPSSKVSSPGQLRPGYPPLERDVRRSGRFFQQLRTRGISGRRYWTVPHLDASVLGRIGENADKPDLDLRLRRPIGNSALFGRASSARKAVTRELFRKPYPCRVWQGARSATSP